MKIAMRLDPSQVPRFLKYTAVTVTTINRDLLMAAGLTKFDVMCIGAPGGRAGDATSSGSKVIEFGSGGGGGGSLRVQGLIKDLPQAIPVSLGGPGSAGSNAGNDTNAGNGTVGGDAVFAGYTAFGGKGGVGGKATASGGVAQSSNPSVGGAGGGNSLAVGAGGVGGQGWDYDQHEDAVAATNGTWVAVGSGGGGKGGGGGRGAGWIGGFNPPWLNMGDKVAGASGATGGDGNQSAPGGAPVSNNGGTGGGANAKPLVGVNEYYGGGGQTGLVVVRFS